MQVIEDLTLNIARTWLVGGFFLAVWPLIGAIVIMLAAHEPPKPISRVFWRALRCSYATYLAVNTPCDPSKHTGARLFHRFLGILAEAYVIAVFIKSIEPGP